ncbi:TonB-dependent receptor plug domain-containing protein [Solitalea koreensis]|uniref:TonB-linked outer membrane protein, SusC/RagA family n=1 Tax=Solitalea koreensis TaxID=543615 RepID=A0A521DZA0_9SPHI|nr:TonB-dependent receptor plug domain-containing protein [Solitalea koreensis]SMO76942.1 TonB-linked outer membrane protein, SusC/RagA family [Solitalea koreensis]
MKQKVYYLLALAGLICLNSQMSYALQPSVKKTFSQADTIRQLQKVTVSVRDLGTSKLLDSVRVTLGKESKFTEKGVVVFGDNKDSILIFSKPGYVRLAKKLTSATLTVSMLKTDESEGFAINPGLSKRVNSLFTGSAVTVEGDKLREINGTNFIDALKFYVPSLTVTKSNNNGSNPNALPEIRLRGANNFPYAATITNNNNSASGVQTAPSSADFIASNVTTTSSPIILLDGIQVSLQTALDIDMNRIQSVTVLKDAAATASYGMRGGNGVIAIQTVKPGRGMNISFSEQVQIATPDISSYKTLSAKEKLDLENKAGLYPGSLAALYQKRYNQAYNNGVNTNWLELPLQNGLSSKHTLAFSSGTDEVVYGFTASYNDIQGSMKGSSRKNLDLGANFGGHFGSFSFNNQFYYLGSNASNSPFGSFDKYAKMNPYWNPYDKFTGKFQKLLEVDTIGENVIPYLNPAYNSTLATTDAAKYARYSNVTNLNWVIGSGFQLDGIASISKQADELNQFLPPNHTKFGMLTADSILKRGLYNYTSNSFLDIQGGVRLQYQKNLGKHTIFTNVGENLAQTNSESEGVAVSGFAVDRLADISFGSAYAMNKPVSGKIATRYASTFGNVTYSYDNRYQVDLSGALDNYSGLSKMSKFGAVGMAWNVHNEKFLKNVSWIDLLKVKGSFGITGNQYFLSYLNRTTYDYYTNQQYIPAGSGTGTIGIGLGAYLTGYGNKNLEAPETYKQDIGLDAVLFKNRLALNLNAFKQRTYKMVLPLFSPASTGFQNFASFDNYGELENGGFEIGAAATVYKSPKNNLNWNIMANTLHAMDKITTASGPIFDYTNINNNTIAPQNTLQPQYVIGKSPYAIWAVPSAGIDPLTGKEAFLKKDGTITTVWDASDKVYAGKLTPTWVGSFGTDVTYKQFALGAYFNYQYGAKVYNQGLANIENKVYNDPSYNILRSLGYAASPTNAVTRLVENDDKIQCSSIMFGYTVPKMFAERIKAKNLALKFLVNNAFEIGGADMQRGIYYPFQRNYTFTLNANF